MKSVVIIEPYSAGKSLLRKSRELGFRSIVLTQNSGQRTQSASDLALADRVEFVDTNNAESVINLLLQLQSEENIDAIVPGFEYYVPLTALGAKALGRPGLAIEHVEKVRIKDKMRMALKEAGLNCPKFHVVSSLNHVEAAACAIGFPAVLKPLNMAGSLGVRRVDTIEELAAAYHLVTSQVTTDLDFALEPAMLLEEYLDGPEFSVEGYIEGLDVRIVTITEKVLGTEPSFIEIGHISQANLDVEVKTAIQLYVNSVVKALHVTLGVIHAEIRLTSRGPVLIELGARLPGDHICDLIQLSTGVNMFEIMLRSHSGLSLPSVEPKCGQHASIIFFVDESLPYYTNVIGESDLAGQPGFIRFEKLIPANTPIPPTFDSEMRIAYCIFTADNYQDLQLRIALARKTIRFVAQEVALQ